MERCLAKNPNINLVYSINEPSGTGASEALKAANKTATIVSVDGGCQGVAEVKSGILNATAQQYPVKMAELGVAAIAKYAKDKTKPTTSAGLDFFDTGAALVTDKPQDGVESITSDAGSKICWGTTS
jgi:fructose transport system substrate-binding protein